MHSLQSCRSTRMNTAVATCFSIECASFNGNRPIRYCSNCNVDRHSSEEGENHMCHSSISEIWACTPEMQRYLMDAIIR